MGVADRHRQPPAQAAGGRLAGHREGRAELDPGRQRRRPQAVEVVVAGAPRHQRRSGEVVDPERAALARLGLVRVGTDQL